MLGKSEKEQMQSEERYYLRYHNAISRAIELNQEIFGDSVGKDGKEPRFQHPLRVAGMCEQIQEQTMDQYHMGWLVGLLHDDKELNPLVYSQKIDYVVQDLLPEEKDQLIRYIDELSSDKELPKGQRKRAQLQNVKKMDLVPSWILIFDKYDNCVRFHNNPVGKTKEQLEGYFSVAYLIYLAARERHEQIRKFMLARTSWFFDDMGERMGGKQGATQRAEKYFESMK